GGKQYKVAKGDVIEVERVKDSEALTFVSLLVVDDEGKTHAQKSKLADARVTARVVGETRGPKIEVFKFRNKSGYKRNTGHKQRYTSVEIADIKLTAGRSKKAEAASANSEVGTASERADTHKPVEKKEKEANSDGT
ncbi:MAG: 50S ribosomal protein L21, partial [Actinomycetota bacterium]